MRFVVTAGLYVIAWFASQVIGGLVLGMLLLPLATSGRAGNIISGVAKGVATAWVAIGILQWSGRSATPFMLLAFPAYAWNGLTRLRAGGVPQPKPRVSRELQDLVGVLLGLAAGWATWGAVRAWLA